MFADDGSVPNNPRLPFVIYRGVIDLIGTPDPEEVIEKRVPRQRLGRHVAQRHLPLRALPFDDPRRHGRRARPRQGALRRQQGRGDRAQPGRRRGAAGRHRPSMPLGQPRSDGDRRLSEDRQATTSAAAARANTPRRWKRSRACRCPTPIRCSASRARCCGSGTAEQASVSCPRPTGSNSGTPSTRSTSMRATRPRTSGASPTTSARYAPERGVMLDYGCGEALSADRVAEPVVAADPVRAGAERARDARPRALPATTRSPCASPRTSRRCRRARSTSSSCIR